MTFIKELADLGIDANTIEKIHRHFSGNPVYITKHGKTDIAARNAEIILKFDGRNVRKLAVEYGVCYQQLRKIVSRVRTRKLNNSVVSAGAVQP